MALNIELRPVISSTQHLHKSEVNKGTAVLTPAECVCSMGSIPVSFTLSKNGQIFNSFPLGDCKAKHRAV